MLALDIIQCQHLTKYVVIERVPNYKKSVILLEI